MEYIKSRFPRIILFYEFINFLDGSISGSIKYMLNYTMYIINYTGNYNSILGEILNAVFVENINEFNEYLNQLTIIGPKLNFKSPWCSNMLEILKKSNITNVSRIEKFRLVTKDGHEEYDNMTENIYNTIPTDLEMLKLPDLTKTVKLENINQVNNDLNLGFDSEDIEYYTSYFRNIDRSRLKCFECVF